MNVKLIFLLIIVLLLSTCSESATEPDPVPLLSLQPESLTISPTESGILALEITDFSASIFGVSLQLIFDSSIVSFSDKSGFMPGNFFGASPIVLTEVEGSTIHLALSLTQGQAELTGSGSLGELTFIGKTTGSSSVQIDGSELHFFDASGAEVNLSELDLEPAIITVQ